MNMKVSEFINYLHVKFPDIKFYNGTINKIDKQCVGVYLKGAAPVNIALGGIANTTTGTLPIKILVHWSENTDICETIAISIYKELYAVSKIVIGLRNIITFDMQCDGPIDVARDENNICEMVIALNIIYER